MPKKLEVGQRVRIRWDLDEAEGIIRDIHGPSDHRFALGAFIPSDGDLERGQSQPVEEHTVSLPLDALEPVPSEASA